MYIANHYVRIGKKVYMKDEAIPAGLPDEKVVWLLKKGAIRKSVPAEIHDNSQIQSLEDDLKDDPERGEVKDDLDDEPECSETQDDSEDDWQDDEVDAREIDVMSGVIRDEKAEEKGARAVASGKGPKNRAKGGKTGEGKNAQSK